MIGPEVVGATPGLCHAMLSSLQKNCTLAPAGRYSWSVCARRTLTRRLTCAGVCRYVSVGSRRGRADRIDEPQAVFARLLRTRRVTPASRLQAFPILPALARTGLVRLVARPLGLVPHLPPEAEKAYLSRMVLPTYLQAYADDAQGMPASGAQAEAVKTLGDIPLIVLTARLNTTTPGWPARQTELLQLSSNSQQMFAEKSGHNIEIDEPDAAVAAIVKMVELVRQSIQK